MTEEFDLNPRIMRFCDEYIKTGNATKSAIAAGYKEKGAGVQGCVLLKKPEVQDYIRKRSTEASNDNIASLTEALEFLSKVMRGEIKDVFDLDAPIAERSKAAVELIKRKGSEAASSSKVTIINDIPMSGNET